MYIKAIEAVDQFTRPIHTLSRTYGGLVTPGSATLFFVNREGIAITCKHVLNQVVHAEELNRKFSSFLAEKAQIPLDGKFKRSMALLEAKYGYKNETTVQMKINFVNCVASLSSFKCHFHPVLDLGILIFEGFSETLYRSSATFVKEDHAIKQGKSLCRLGYPFPEFTNFQYNKATDDIEWIESGNRESPKFPMDGIITRFGSDGAQIISIEMSTPGLKGQSGGPLSDQDGLVYQQHLLLQIVAEQHQEEIGFG